MPTKKKTTPVAEITPSSTPTPRPRSQKGSRVLGVIIAIVIVGSVLYGYHRFTIENIEQGLGQNNSSLRQEVIDLRKQLAVQTTEIENSLYRLVDDRCGLANCLFTHGPANTPAGLTVIKGYYTAGENKACDGFTVTSGPAAFLNAMLGGVEPTVDQPKNDQDQPIINLDLSELSGPAKNTVSGSTVEAEVELLVLIPVAPAAEVAACTIDAIVLGIN